MADAIAGYGQTTQIFQKTKDEFDLVQGCRLPELAEDQQGNAMVSSLHWKSLFTF